MSTIDNKCNLCERIGLRPFTKQNILYYYAPLHSMIGYGALSVNVMNPGLASRLLPKKDITNFLLVHTLLGTSLYLYSRPHLQDVDPKKRVAYSIVGSSLFGLGSVLVWAILRSTFSSNTAVSTAIGIGTGYAIARISYDYLDHVDSKVVAKKSSA